MALRLALGTESDVDAAVAVFVRSNLVRRRGSPIPPGRIEQIATSLRNPASWFVVADDGGQAVGMASAMPYRADDGAGPEVPGVCYVDLVFVVPERWGEGIGGRIIDAVVEEARRRGYSRIQLWTHEDNERSHRLYRRRGFMPNGRTRRDDEGGAIGEWAREM